MVSYSAEQIGYRFFLVQLSGGAIIKGAIVQGTIVQGAMGINYLGVNCPQLFPFAEYENIKKLSSDII